ncbi:hypothetical protein ALC60_04542 [Trachymyrmex zeteki]|uniref:Uncharacterized protein n=1 Tax=Mycetomoellerius zeteki TaxID=64791 RepID=A0A151X7V8_9HYME|nr:hypothetical protein ALC60_04542 [Trachymyrmex zeteki]
MRGGRLDNAKARKLCTKPAGSILKYFGVFADRRTQAPKKYDQQTLSKESEGRKRKKSEVLVKSRTKSSLTDTEHTGQCARQSLQTHLIKSNLAMGQATKIRRSCKGAYTRFGPAGTEDPLSPTDDSTRMSPSGNAINTSDNVFNSMNSDSRSQVVDYADADGRLTRWWDRFKDRVGRSSTIGSGSGSLATRRTRTPCPPFQPIPPAPFDYPVVQSCRPLAVATRFLGPPESPTPSRSTL